LTLTLYLL